VSADCPADSGDDETYTADERKMAVSSQQKAMSVLWYWETKSVIHVIIGNMENKHLEDSPSNDGWNSCKRQVMPCIRAQAGLQ
jgi:hypothetical protein